MKVKVEAKTKNGQGQKYICPELHETHESEIKKLPIQIILVDLNSRPLPATGRKLDHPPPPKKKLQKRNCPGCLIRLLNSSSFCNFLIMVTCCWIQAWAKRVVPGLVNFVPAVTYHFCLNLAENFSQPGDLSLALANIKGFSLIT